MAWGEGERQRHQREQPPHDDLDLFQPAHGLLLEAAPQGERTQLGIGHVYHGPEGEARLFEAVKDQVGRMAHGPQYSAGGIWVGQGGGETRSGRRPDAQPSLRRRPAR